MVVHALGAADLALRDRARCLKGPDLDEAEARLHVGGLIGFEVAGGVPASAGAPPHAPWPA